MGYNVHDKRHYANFTYKFGSFYHKIGKISWFEDNVSSICHSVCFEFNIIKYIRTRYGNASQNALAIFQMKNENAGEYNEISAQ